MLAAIRRDRASGVSSRTTDDAPLGEGTADQFDADGQEVEAGEKLASKALRESDSYLGELEDSARNIERTARLLSQFFISPVRKRPFEIEISDCKQRILSFLRKRGVNDVNHYGWILLRGVFEGNWKAGKGKDQIEAFRAIPRPFTGRITTRKKAEIVMEKTKMIVFKMTNEQNTGRTTGEFKKDCK